MLNINFLRESRALWHMDMLIWLINHNGPPHTPNVPSPLHFTQPLSQRCWGEMDTRMPLIWAEDEVAHIIANTKLPIQNISIIPDVDQVLRHSTSNTPNSSHKAHFTAGWQKTPDLRINLNIQGQPIILYDPRRCMEPGYFSAKVIMAMARIYVGMNEKPDNFMTENERALTWLAACFSGQGFVLLDLSEKLFAEMLFNREITQKYRRSIHREITFTTVLCLASKGMMAEQIIATYGPIISKSVRRNIWSIYKQISRYDQKLKMLRLLINRNTKRPNTCLRSISIA